MLLSLPFPTTGYEIYVLSFVALWGAAWAQRVMRERSARGRLMAAMDGGSAAPETLHPLINAEKCVGCGACTHACPEGKIIGMIGGKAQLLEPAACIGHGACQTACPVGAIDLVFGSARRGVDIPYVSASFETTSPGIYIAGELGGMGLIANAIEQGRQAIDAIAARTDLKKSGVYDVVIVGAGPAGIAATLAAKEKGLSALTVEQDTVGGTVARYPRGKIVMTRPAKLPLFGNVKLRRARKERLMTLWQSVLQKTGTQIYEGVRVNDIQRTDWGYVVSTTAGETRASTVLLAMGRRGSPRRLGVQGEDLPKVTYSLADASQYRGRHMLVVGGGDSALEAVLELARQPLASLTLAYRGDAISRAKPALRQRLDAAAKAGQLHVLLQSNVRAIEPSRVMLDMAGRSMVVRNDNVIICAGGTLPRALLADIGIQVERKYGTA